MPIDVTNHPVRTAALAALALHPKAELAAAPGMGGSGVAMRAVIEKAPADPHGVKRVTFIGPRLLWSHIDGLVAHIASEEAVLLETTTMGRLVARPHLVEQIQHVVINFGAQRAPSQVDTALRVLESADVAYVYDVNQSSLDPRILSRLQELPCVQLLRP